MNKFKYAITNGESVIGVVYEHKTYGRTLVIFEKVDLNNPIQIWDRDANTPLADKDFTEFIYELLPVT